MLALTAIAGIYGRRARRGTGHSTDMTTLRDAADEFLAQHRIAVAGVSRDAKQPANLIYRRLRDTGHEVFAVNPNAGEVEGDPCYRASRPCRGRSTGSSS